MHETIVRTTIRTQENSSDKSQQEQADDLVETFDIFDEWEDRYSFLIDMGKKLPPLADTLKTEDNRVYRVRLCPEVGRCQRVIETRRV